MCANHQCAPASCADGVLNGTETGIDCGDAVIGPEMGVYYYCEPCLVAINAEINAAVFAETQTMAEQRQPGWRAPGGEPTLESFAMPPSAPARWC